MAVLKTKSLGAVLVSGTRAKFKSPSNKRNASPGGRFLNLADTLRVVPGSTKTYQPVAEATCPSSFERVPVLISALTRFWFVRHARVSAANAEKALNKASVSPRRNQPRKKFFML